VIGRDLGGEGAWREGRGQVGMVVGSGRGQKGMVAGRDLGGNGRGQVGMVVERGPGREGTRPGGKVVVGRGIDR
jgi:hypothetical protein